MGTSRVAPTEHNPASLQASLQRVRQAAARQEQREAELLQSFLRETAHLPPMQRWRAERRLRRALRRQRRHGPVALIPGAVTGLWAIVFAALAASDPSGHGFLGWVAVGFGSASAVFVRRAIRSGVFQRERSPSGDGRVAEEDPRLARVDAICDKLLAELRAGSRVVRDVVQRPEETVQGLRQTCHELVQRERALRAAVTPEDEARLSRERAGLVARVEAEKDVVVRQRLSEALAALDRQLAQRAELRTAAARLEAEHTRLTFTLEELYTQVLRVKAADASGADIVGAGLRGSLERLSSELNAVAESLEAVHTEMAPISSISSDAPASLPERERS